MIDLLEKKNLNIIKFDMFCETKLSGTFQHWNSGARFFLDE